MEYDLAVVGLGYVGLPVAVEATRVGLRVAGLDISRDVVDGLANGTSHIDDLSDADIAAAVASGFTPSADNGILAGAANIIIAVPTPLEGHVPDLTMVTTAAEAIGAHLTAGQLVVLESTTYPGTTEEVVLPILEERSGLKAGTDFFLAFSPERIDPGNKTWTLRNTPKVVGGIDEASTQRAAALYEALCDQVVRVSGTREAEMTKLLENTYRHVNIALINELALFCNEIEIDVWEVIKAAGTKPFGFQVFTPGPGVGGHCIPVDPNYLSFRARQLGYQFRFVELAQEINDRMPRYVIDRIVAVLNDSGKAVRNSRILLVGMAYKPDVSDLRESPALRVADLLAGMGADLSYCDPMVPAVVVIGDPIARVMDPVAAAATSDLVVILTAHSVFDIPAIVAAAPAVFDTRGVAAVGPANRL
jgi:nucleotide sugar dehydrogenase